MGSFIKWLGAGLGFTLGGPIGAMLGYAIGSIADGASFTEFDTNQRRVNTGGGREPLVVGAAFGLNEGETSSLIDGTNGVYMVKVTKVTPAVELDNYQAAANRLEQQKTSSVTSKLYNALKEAADIEDNRAETQVQ